MLKSKIDEILRLHTLWLDDDTPIGTRANFTGADLTEANLSGADLTLAYLTRAYLTRADLYGADLTLAYFTEADLTGANLTEADLTEANLTGANLTLAYLTRAYLTRADLYGADLTLAYLTGANLTEADLTRANLSGANFTGANLSGADLSGANFTRANFTGANLTRADLTDVKNLAQFQIVPQFGKFIGWKKLANDRTIRVMIPAKSKRLNSIGSRKCRAEFVVPLDDCGEEKNHEMNSGTVRYVKNRTTKCDKYDPDIRVECSGGIQFFITREEAEAWNC